jgi:hypothetical protein
VDFETNLQQRFDVQRLHFSRILPAGTGLSSHEVNQPGSYRADTTVVAQKAIEATLPTAWFW